jgi:hypothetical protein
MRTSLLAWLAAASSIVPAIALPVAPARAQVTSSAATVSLTVVVPPRVTLGGSGGAGRGTGSMRGSPSALDERPRWEGGAVEITRRVGFANARASRIDVRLDAGGPSLDGVRVLVRGGTMDDGFRPLVAGATLAVSRAASAEESAPADVTFRIESDDPARLRGLALPVSFRVVQGSGETAIGWSVADVLTTGR